MITEHEEICGELSFIRGYLMYLTVEDGLFKPLAQRYEELFKRYMELNKQLPRGYWSS